MCVCSKAGPSASNVDNLLNSRTPGSRASTPPTPGMMLYKFPRASLSWYAVKVNGRVIRRLAKGGHVLFFEVLSSVQQALALYGKMSGFSQSLTCPHCWLQWHNIISIYPVLSYFVTCSLQVLFDLLQVLFDYLNLNKRQMEKLTLTRRLLFCPPL